MIARDEHVHHECWEEIIVLQGDVFLINEGQMGIGSVVGHPQEWYHAPFVSGPGHSLWCTLTDRWGSRGLPRISRSGQTLRMLFGDRDV